MLANRHDGGSCHQCPPVSSHQTRDVGKSLGVFPIFFIFLTSHCYRATFCQCQGAQRHHGASWQPPCERSTGNPTQGLMVPVTGSQLPWSNVTANVTIPSIGTVSAQRISIEDVYP